MRLETILFAGRPGDEGHGAKLAQTFVDIAKPTNARLVVAQIFTKEEYKNTKTSLGINDEPEEVSEQIANQHQTFRTIVDRLDSEGLDYELSTAIGPHADTIVDLAADADLVIIGGKNGRRLEKPFLDRRRRRCFSLHLAQWCTSVESEQRHACQLGK